MPKKEQVIKGEVLRWLKRHGCLAMRINSGAMSVRSERKNRWIQFSSEPGTSDILGVLPGGRFFAIEVKRPGQKPTPKQEAFLQRVTRRGGLALVASSGEDLERVVGPLIEQP